MDEGFILWESLLIIPAQVQLHEANSGVSRMKTLARSYMWWPNMNAYAETGMQNQPSYNHGSV